MEDIAGARSLLETSSELEDDPDTDINYGCLLYKVLTVLILLGGTRT